MIEAYEDPDLTFDEAKHIYLYKGERVNSVTQIMKADGLSEPYDDVDPRVLANAAARGTAVHTAIERYHLGTLNWDDLHEEIEPRVLAYTQFVEEYRYEHLCSERKYYSKKWKYAGGMDGVGILPSYNGVDRPALVLLDYKTSYKKDEPGWKIQLQAYRNLWDENNPDHKIDHCLILWLNRLGKYEPINADCTESWALFAYAVRKAHWKKKHGRK